MQAYAACGDPEIRAVVRSGYGDLVTYVERVSGASSEKICRVLRARDAAERARLDGGARVEPWGAPPIAGCKSDQAG